MALPRDVRYLILSYLPLTQIQLWLQVNKRLVSYDFWKFTLIHRYGLNNKQIQEWFVRPIQSGWLTSKQCFVKLLPIWVK